MSKSKGEGRSSAEKSQRIVETPEAGKARREKRKREEAEWAAKSSPVIVRRKETHRGNDNGY